MRILLVLLAAISVNGQKLFRFTTSQPAEVIAIIELSSPEADWAKPGHEAAVASVSLDGKPHQHVILFAGQRHYGYRISLGTLAAGEHTVEVKRDDTLSSPGVGLEAYTLKAEEIGRSHADYDVHANAPVLFARLNTIGKFSDVPLLLYCERLEVNGQSMLQYTVIFSNEDGGTSTRTLMARWGRATDIEYVYRRSLLTHVATVQGPGHVDVEFKGAHDLQHPLLMPVTDNNMVAAAKDSPLQFRLAPIMVDLSQASREQVMDRYPVTYEVMAKELEREHKLRPFGVIDGEKISDPRNYLYVDYAATLTHGALTVLMRTKDGNLYSSDLGRGDVAIARDGYVRTTVELPPRTSTSDIAEISFECRVPPASRTEPAAHSGSCVLQKVVKAFQLQPDYVPANGFWTMTRSITLATGHGVSFVP